VFTLWNIWWRSLLRRDDKFGDNWDVKKRQWKNEEGLFWKIFYEKQNSWPSPDGSGILFLFYPVRVLNPDRVK